MLMQRLDKEAGLRDDSRYGDRKRVALTGADGGALEVRQTLQSLTTEPLLEIARLEAEDEPKS